MDLYGDEKPEAPEKEMEGADENTALLPKSLFPEGCKPGDKITIEVVASYDDENEVKVVSAEKKPAPEGETDDSMSGAEGRMEQLAEA